MSSRSIVLVRTAILLLIPVLAAGCEKFASAQDANPAPSNEIADNPDILLSATSADDLTLNGVHLGSPESAIPGNLIKFRHDDHLDCTNGSYTIVNGRVWSMSLTDRDKLKQLQLPQQEPELIQMRLGKADQIEEAVDAKIWRGYWFTSRRSAKFTNDDDYVGWVSVSISK